MESSSALVSGPQAFALQLRPGQAEAVADGGAVLLQRMDAVLVVDAANEALADETRELLAQLRAAAHSLQRVRAMAAAVATVERLRGEAIGRGGSAMSALDDVETVGVALDALVGMAVGEFGKEGDTVETEERMVDEAEALLSTGSVDRGELLASEEIGMDETIPLGSEFVEKEDGVEPFMAEPHGRGGEAPDGPSPTESLDLTDDGGHSAGAAALQFPAAEMNQTETSVSTIQRDAKRPESKDLPTEGACLPPQPHAVGSEERERAESTETHEKQSTEQRNERDLSITVITNTAEQSSFNEVKCLKTENVSLDERKGSKAMVSTEPNERTSQAVPSPAAAPNPSGQAVDNAVPTITNSLALAAACLARCQRVNACATLRNDVQQIDTLATHVARVVRAVEKAHRVNRESLDGELLANATRAIELLAGMVYDHTPCLLAVIRLFVRVRQPLERATHPALAELFQQHYKDQLRHFLMACFIPSSSGYERDTAFAWLLLSFVAHGHQQNYCERVLLHLIPVFRRWLMPNGVEADRTSSSSVSSLPIVYLAVEIAVHVAIQFARPACVAQLHNTLFEIHAQCRGRSDFLMRHIEALHESLESSGDVPKSTQPLTDFDWEGRCKEIQKGLKWYLAKRRQHQKRKLQEAIGE